MGNNLHINHNLQQQNDHKTLKTSLYVYKLSSNLMLTRCIFLLNIEYKLIIILFRVYLHEIGE